MSMKDRLSGTLRLTALTPVHIGSGGVLAPMDYTIRGNRFIVKDVLAFFEANRDSVQYALDAVESGLDIGDGFARYTLPSFIPKPQDSGPLGGGPREARGTGGAPRTHKDPDRGSFNSPFASLGGNAQPEPVERPAAKKTAPAPAKAKQDSGYTVGEVREFIKDPFGRPFIPGSSVKGSLRTALAWAIAETYPLSDRLNNALRDQRLRKEWAGSEISKDLFGKTPNQDGLRALRIADSAPLKTEDTLAASHVKVMNARFNGFQEKRETPVYVECLLPGKTVELPFHIDLWTLDKDRDIPERARGLVRDPGKIEEVFRNYTKALLDYERKFYDGQKLSGTVGLLDQLRRQAPIMLATGYGTGWHAKTLALRMSDDDVDAIRDRFGKGRDGRPNKNMGNPNAPIFPKTRKWANGPAGYQPMGLLKLELLWG